MKRKRDTRDAGVPNQAANKSKADDERWSSDSDTVERREQERAAEQGSGSDEGSGISNRPIGEEMRNQELLPDRGTAREGVHGGHGDRDRSDEEQ
jgi:hypothetical protein